jgi:rubrerythrin
VFTVNEIVDIAIRLEKNGEAVYRQAIENVSNPEIASILEWMADEEVRHAEKLSELKNHATDQPTGISVEEIGPDFLNDIIGKQSFSLQDIDFADIDQVSELLDIFIEFENDGILFYEMLQPFVRGERNRKMIATIIHEEKEHIKILKEKITELAET